MATEKRSFDSAPKGGKGNLDAQRGPNPDPPLVEEANPQNDWGEPADEGATYSANHATRGRKAEGMRSQGRKTRQATKDQISRR
jgi:hypothetical protein